MQRDLPLSKEPENLGVVLPVDKLHVGSFKVIIPAKSATNATELVVVPERKTKSISISIHNH
jgi:hypothetical protein